MATVTFDKAQRWYPGNDKPTVPSLDLEIGDGEFMVLVGPSGCGKSTSLRMLAGLEEINGGKIFIGDRDVTHVPPKDRDIAMVFQNYALYPHMTVADNMAFALKMAKVPVGGARASASQEAAKILGLDRVPRAQAEGALRWPAPARRDGPRDRPQPAGVLHGRAAVQPRRQDARADPHRHRQAPVRPRRHHRLRDPRPGRGHDDGRPRRGDEPRRADAGRHPAEPLRQARQPVRRRLHRLPADEPDQGALPRTARPRSATTWCRSTRRLQAARRGPRQHHRRRAARGLAAGRRERGRPAGRGDRGRGARRRRLRLRQLRRRGHAGQRHRPGQRPRPRQQGRHDLRHHRPARTCTSSTPTPASASATELHRSASGRPARP